MARRRMGLCIMQSTVRRGLRCSASVAYLRPAMKCPNLVVSEKSLVLEMLWTERALSELLQPPRPNLYGLCCQRGRPLRRRDNLPQVLMLSGIGAADELAEHGIDCKVDLPNVGKNLQDHLSVGIEYERKEDGPLHGVLRSDRTWPLA